MDTQRQAATDAHAAAVALLDALGRLVAPMGPDCSDDDAALDIRFAAAVRLGMSDDDCSGWLALRSAVVPALDTVADLCGVLHNAPVVLDTIRRSVEGFRDTDEAHALRRLDALETTTPAV